MSQNGKTPGQAAYEAYYAAVATLPGILLPPWDELVGAEHRAWDTAAQAATARHSLSGTGALTGDIIALQAERDDLRELVREILSALGPRPNGISNPQRRKWAERAGLEG